MGVWTTSYYLFDQYKVDRFEQSFLNNNAQWVSW